MKSKKQPGYLATMFLFVAVFFCGFGASPLWADEMELVTAPALEIAGTPVNTVFSTNGKYLYVLTEDHYLLVYAPDGSLLGKALIDPSIDHIAAGRQDEAFLLISRINKTIQTGTINFIREIDVSGCPVKGPETAKVKFVVFSDFQCPSCAGVAETLDELLAEYPHDVQIAFKHFPLRTHRYAVKASIAAMAAQRQGQFWTFHDLAFSEGQRLNDRKIIEMAKDLNLDMSTFHADYRDPAMVGKIRAGMHEAALLGVDGTPTIFINGRMVKDWTKESLKKSVEDILSRTSCNIQATTLNEYQPMQ